MEVGLPSAMETFFHWPTLSWAIASAFVLFWGTGLFASSKQLNKDSLIQSRLLNLRRKSTFVLRFCFEEFLYTFMALLNMAMGVVFWVLDWYLDGASPLNANYFPVENQLAKVKEPDLRNPTLTEGKATHRPKRAGIFRPRKGYGDVCGCWGYEVDDLPPSAGKSKDEVSSYKNGSVASQVLYFYRHKICNREDVALLFFLFKNLRLLVEFSAWGRLKPLMGGLASVKVILV